jgi:hypothetical protein
LTGLQKFFGRQLSAFIHLIECIAGEGTYLLDADRETDVQTTNVPASVVVRGRWIWGFTPTPVVAAIAL